MENIINRLIEKAVNNPITLYQRELIKVGILLVVGIVMGVNYGIKGNQDLQAILLYSGVFPLYLVGFVYGIKTIFRLLTGTGGEAAEAGMLTTIFAGGYVGMFVGLFLLGLVIMISLVGGWIAGYINLFRKLMSYKAQDNEKSYF